MLRFIAKRIFSWESGCEACCFLSLVHLGWLTVQSFISRQSHLTLRIWK